MPESGKTTNGRGASIRGPQRAGTEGRAGRRHPPQAEARGPVDRGAAGSALESASDSSALVIRHIQKLIREHRIAPGDRLPSEIGLAKDLNVARSSVTKAYAKLEAYGLVRSIPQSGTYLAAIGGDALNALFSSVGNSEIQFETEDIGTLYLFRSFVDEMAAVTLAERRNPADIRRLRDVVKEVRDRILAGGAIEDDLIFHITLTELAGRPFLKSLAMFSALPMVTLFRHWERTVPANKIKERWKVSMNEHDEIVDAIAAGDPARARQAVRDHFQHALENRQQLRPVPGAGDGKPRKS
jgi:GntR family transcriptional regulator, transcriptional repressor for pyruvate dehydrogenase complex